jgi:hypothetical protein
MPQNELEKKIGEYQDLPAHILGLDGWLLRNIPRESRVTFLKGYEKLMRVIYSPDRTQDPVDKNRRDLYIRAVARAVSFLTSDSFAFDLCVDEVPSKQNPIIQLEKKSDRHLAEITGLKKQLKLAEENLTWERAKIEALEKFRGFLRLREYDCEHFENSVIFEIPKNRKILIGGRMMGLHKETDYTPLRASLLAKHPYNQRHREFSAEVEQNYLDNKTQDLVFRGAKLRKGETDLILMGGLPLESIREYLEFHHSMREHGGKLIHHLDFKRALDSLELQGTTNFERAKEYDQMVQPFLTPYLMLYSPVLIKQITTDPKTKIPRHSTHLFYVEGVNPRIN